MVAKKTLKNKNSIFDKIKSRKLTKFGLPIAVILVFAAGGTYMVRRSNAQSSLSGSRQEISVIQGHNCSTAGKYPSSIQRGSVGECVKAFQIGINNWTAIQSYLTAGKYPNNQLATDGNFGAATAAKAREFQSKEGLATDGIVGQNTWDAFLKNCFVTKTHCPNTPYPSK